MYLCKGDSLLGNGIKRRTAVQHRFVEPPPRPFPGSPRVCMQASTRFRACLGLRIQCLHAYTHFEVAFQACQGFAYTHQLPCLSGTYDLGSTCVHLYSRLPRRTHRIRGRVDCLGVKQKMRRTYQTHLPHLSDTLVKHPRH